MSIECERHKGVLTVRINRPERRNALDPRTIEELGAAFCAAETDDSVRCVLLTAEGNRAFCAGMDLKAFAAGEIETDPGRPGLEVISQRIYPKPIVAAVNGIAVGGGFELMLACDIVIAADHARFGLTEVKHGLVPLGGGTRLPGRIPLAVALEIGLTGDLIDAQRAYALGLVNRVVPREQLHADALDIAIRIAANSPLAVTITKRLMLEEMGGGNWDHINQSIAQVFASEDALEGARAFAEKRAPRWAG